MSSNLVIYTIPFLINSHKVFKVIEDLDGNDPEFIEFEEMYFSVFSWLLSVNGFRKEENEFDKDDNVSGMHKICMRYNEFFKKKMNRMPTPFFEMREEEKTVA